MEGQEQDPGRGEAPAVGPTTVELTSAECSSVETPSNAPSPPAPDDSDKAGQVDEIWQALL